MTSSNDYTFYLSKCFTTSGGWAAVLSLAPSRSRVTWHRARRLAVPFQHSARETTTCYEDAPLLRLPPLSTLRLAIRCARRTDAIRFHFQPTGWPFCSCARSSAFWKASENTGAPCSVRRVSTEITYQLQRNQLTKDKKMLVESDFKKAFWLNQQQTWQHNY